MTRHYAESNINILLTRNLPTDSCVRQWNHLLMIPLHCLWAKSNNRKHGQFECDDTWIWMIWFCWFTCTVHLLFSGFLDRVGGWVGDRGDGSFRKDFEIKWTVGGGSWKFDNFHGRHMCVVPKWKQECHQTKINQLYFYSATFIRFYSTQTWFHIYFEWSSIQEFVSKADFLAPISTVYSSVLLSLSKEKR